MVTQSTIDAKQRDVSDALSNMTALLAHEMRNPLAAAMGQAELLEMIIPDSQTRDSVSAILSQLSRLDRLTQSLLDFVHSRRVDKVTHNCAELLLEIKAMVPDRRLKIKHQHMPEQWSFDVTMLSCAIKNIVSNALDFSDPEAPVELMLAEEEEDLLITVRDFGEGLPDDLDIFEPFTTTRFQSAGLGMAIASEIVLAHGGEMDADDHPDGGAIVTIRIPREETPLEHGLGDAWSDVVLEEDSFGNEG